MPHTPHLVVAEMVRGAGLVGVWPEGRAALAGAWRVGGGRVGAGAAGSAERLFR